jgi:hypothetical protein
VRVEDDPCLLAHKTILAIDNEALIALPGFSASAVAQHPRWDANPWIHWSTRLGEVERRQNVVLLGIGTTAAPPFARHARLPLLLFSNTTILQGGH